MVLRRRLQSVLSGLSQLPLGTVLVVPFMLQMVGTVALVGYLSHRASRQAIESLTLALRAETAERVHQQVKTYTLVPHAINQITTSALVSGDIDVATNDGDRVFWRQAKSYPMVSHVYCATPEGEFLGAGRSTQAEQMEIFINSAATGYRLQYYSLDAQGNRVSLQRQINRTFDPRERPWYQAAVRESRAVWSPIYLDWDAQMPILTAAMPAYQGKTLVGVCGADILLPQELNQYLKRLTVSPRSQIFILDRQGAMIASSRSTEVSQARLGEPLLQAQDSADPVVRETVAYLRSQFNGLDQIQADLQFAFPLAGARHWVQVSPLKDAYGLDWLVVVALPESDFTAKLQAKRHLYVVLSLVAVGASVALGLAVLQWVVRPIRQLQQAAQRMAQGHLAKPVNVHRSGDLGHLATAFNTMSAQLQQSFAHLEQLNRALQASEQRWQQFLEAIPVGVSVHDHRGQFVYLNKVARELLRLEDLPSDSWLQFASRLALYKTGQDTPYPTEALPLLQSLSGKPGWANDVELRWPDRSVPLEITSIPIFNSQGQVEYALAAFQDITTHHQARKLLADYNQTLEAQVQERTQALRQSEATQQIILSAIPDLLIRYSGDGICLGLISSGEVPLIATGPGQIGLHVSQILPPQMAEERLCYIQKALATGQMQVYEYVFSLQSELHHEEARVIVSGENEVLVIIRDITERKRIEIALRESQALYRSLADSLPHCLYRVDQSGHFTFANPAFLQMLGLTLADCLGKSVYDLYPQATADQFAAAHQQVLTAGHPQSVTEVHTHPFSAETIYIQAIRSPVYSATGDIVGLQGVFWDVTDQKQAEVALADQKRFLQQVIDTMPSAMFVKDRQGILLAVNRACAQMYGIEPDQMVGRVEPDFNPYASEAMMAVKHAINEQVMQSRVDHRDEQQITDIWGRSRWYQVVISPFIHVNGEVQGIIGNCLDITEHKEMQAALTAANQQLSRLATLDGLTQVPNRRRFDEYLDEQWHRLMREQRPLSLILFDVDFFKDFNDYYGHQHGDDCLIAIAQTGKAAVKRAVDLLARYGGEEFAVILPNTNRTGAETVAKNLQQQIAELNIPHQASQISDRITISMGIASTVPSTDLAVEDLIAAADAALYQAKRRGRNRYWIRLV